MVKTAEACAAGHLRSGCGPVFDRSSVRSIFLERIVSAIFLVIRHVFANEPPQMILIQRNDVIEKLSATATDPPLGQSILPRRLNARPLQRQARALQKRDHVRIELRIPV